MGQVQLPTPAFGREQKLFSADTRTFPLREANTGRTLVGRFPSRPLPMPVRKPSPTSTHEQHPRSAYQEIADLLTTALLRLRAGNAANAPETSGLRLGFGGQQRVNANPSRQEGDRKSVV